LRETDVADVAAMTTHNFFNLFKVA